MNRVINLLVYVFVLMPGLVSAQQVIIKGVVESSGRNLEGCTVSIGDQETKTDSTGSFILSTIAGKNRISDSGIGFENFYRNIQLHGDTSIVIEMEPETAQLGEVVISGTARPVQRLESPVAVEVYTPQFFKKNPTPSMFESLQNINGVRPQINCSVCNTGDIHINGLEGPYTMITIDGMPMKCVTRLLGWR